MSRRRLKRLLSGQGWIESTRGQLGALRDAVVSDQAESAVRGEGKVRVHRLEPFSPKPEVERVNVSGEVGVTPLGSVRKR